MCAIWALRTKLDNQSVNILLEELNEFLIDSENQQNFDLKRYPSLKVSLVSWQVYRMILKNS